MDTRLPVLIIIGTRHAVTNASTSTNSFHLQNIIMSDRTNKDTTKSHRHAYPPPDLEEPTMDDFNEDHSSSIFSKDYYREVPKASAAGGRQSRLLALMVGVAMLAVAAAGVYFFMERKDYSLKREGGGQHENFQGQVTVASMALHNTAEDCWMEIHGNVYDLTEYAPDHPGGPEYVTDYCGMNATRPYSLEHAKALLPLISKYNLGAVTLNNTQEASATASTGATAASTNQGAGATPSQPQSSDDSSDDSSDSEDGDTVPGPSSPSTPKPPTPSTPKPPTPNTPNPPAPSSTTTTAAPPTTGAPTSQPEGCPVQIYTVEDVAAHFDQFDCWYILYGVVYDFTTYVDEHPGGARRVFEHCGTDATVPYAAEKKHDQDLLAKKVPELLIGYLGNTTGVQYVACEAE